MTPALQSAPPGKPSAAPVPATSSSSQEPVSFVEAAQQLWSWCLKNPVQALLFGVLLAALVWFYGYFRVYLDGRESAAVWAWRAWNSENDLEHGWIIFPGALFIAWYHREELRAAPKSSSGLGLAVVLVGAALFVIAVRTLQARLAIVSLPLLLWGGVRYLWGPKCARILLFPCVFLLFMVPAGFLVSRTVALQNMAATVAAKLSTVIGIGVESDGAMLRAVDGTFQYEVAGGCSGIRSLTAMTMLAALFVHFTQTEMWKKIAVFLSSLGFALLGNFARLFSVVLVAKLFNPKFAGELYHDWSGFIFFPIAVMGMVGFANLLNRDWGGLLTPERPVSAGGGAPLKSGSAPGTSAPGAGAPNNPETKSPAKPLTYDY